jgi:hypothetical protein
MEELLNTILCREGLSGWEKAVYKGTDCGAWIERTACPEGVRVGSIVEGAEQCAEPISLTWPFTEAQFWEALQDIENQCEEIWNETHDENGGEL